MHHKEGLPGHSAPPAGAEVLDLDSDASSTEEQCEESPEDVELNVLESMINPSQEEALTVSGVDFRLHKGSR